MKRKTIDLAGIVLLLFLTGCSRQNSQTPTGDRIVSLAPNMTEIVCAIGAGDMLVGRTSSCNFPKEIVNKVHTVGDFGAPSLESILAARPTLILEVDFQNALIRRKFDELHLKRLVMPCRNLDDIAIAIRSVGILVHKESEADRLADYLTAEINEYKRAAPKKNRLKVFVETSSNPLTTPGSKSFISELVNLAGGENIGDRIARPYFEVSSEWVVSHNPDIILCLEKSTPGSPGKLVMKRPGWQTVSAIRGNRVYDNLNIDVISRPGPRVIQGIEELRECIAGNRKNNTN